MKVDRSLQCRRPQAGLDSLSGRLNAETARPGAPRATGDAVAHRARVALLAWQDGDLHDPLLTCGKDAGVDRRGGQRGVVSVDVRPPCRTGVVAGDLVQE